MNNTPAAVAEHDQRRAAALAFWRTLRPADKVAIWSQIQSIKAMLVETDAIAPMVCFAELGFVEIMLATESTSGEGT